jgi:hypothetical protein
MIGVLHCWLTFRVKLHLAQQRDPRKAPHWGRRAFARQPPTARCQLQRLVGRTHRWLAPFPMEIHPPLPHLFRPFYTTDILTETPPSRQHVLCCRSMLHPFPLTRPCLVPSAHTHPLTTDTSTCPLALIIPSLSKPPAAAINRCPTASRPPPTLDHTPRNAQPPDSTPRPRPRPARPQTLLLPPRPPALD